MTCELVIFDLDGTLVEFPYEFLLGETGRVLDLIGHPPVARTVLEKSFAAFDFFRFVPPENREDFLEKFWQEFKWDNHPPLIPIAGALRVLQLLQQQGIRSAIATARAISRERLIEHLGPTGFLPFLSQIETRESDQLDWKDKLPQLKSIIVEQQVSLERILAVGDVPPDTTNAQKSGIGLTAAVLSGGIERKQLSAVGPRWLARDVSELFETLVREKIITDQKCKQR